MMFEIDFTYIITSFVLWAYAIENIGNAVNQIENTTLKMEITNKIRAKEFFDNFLNIIYFTGIYFTGILTSDNILSLYYFIIFVVIHHIARIIYGFRKYPDNIKTWSMFEIYINMILYMGTALWMCYLWVL